VLPRGALLDFAGGQREPLAFGGSLRNVDSLTPLTLADGSRAVAWTDNNGKLGRVHLGHEGSPDRPEPAAPRLQVSMTGSRTIRGESPLVLRATCDAACDIYAQLADHEEVVDGLSLPAAGSRRIVLPPLLGPIVPRRGGPVRVLLRSSAPGGHTVTARTLTLHLRRAKAVLPSPPLGLTAVRDGDEIVVRWRTAKPESPHGYSVLGLDADGEPVTGGDVPGKAKRASFVVGLADGRRQAEEATVLGAGEETSETARTTVPVQG
jgi:hypothetical protein